MITLGTNGRVNASAAGVVWDGNLFSMRIFEGSNTFSNLASSKNLGLCFFGEEQILPLVRAALQGYGNEDKEFGEEDYKEVGQMPLLKNSPASIVCSVVKKQETLVEDHVGHSRAISILCAPEDGSLVGEVAGRIVGRVAGNANAGHHDFIPIKMGMSPVLKAASAATRALFLAKNGDGPRAELYMAKAHKLLGGEDKNQPSVELIYETLENIS